MCPWLGFVEPFLWREEDSQWLGEAPAVLLKGLGSTGPQGFWKQKLAEEVGGGGEAPHMPM